MTDNILTGKTTIIYGAGGSIGAATARTFADRGAHVHLVGRTRAPLDAVAADIAARGGRADVAVLDAADERAVEEHAAGVGRIDVSFNLVTRGDDQGTPLVDMTTERFLHAITLGLTTAFVTARAAARRMAEQGHGVILHLNSGSGAGAAPMMGNTGPADAATETFYRYLAAENGRHGVRVVGIRTAGVAGTLTREKIAKVSGNDQVDVDAILAHLAGMTMLGRTPDLRQIADTAAFLASDGAGAITSGTVNATCGLIAG
jgi:NAD(P)-dependent dehydrogenase (short-subunit alcohol dehydrogenase family)